MGEDQSYGSESGYTKDESSWYKDGNIITVAQDVGFRLYRGLLARQSEDFADMFSFPQPISRPRHRIRHDLDGCPQAVVHVTDTAAEMRSVLKALPVVAQYRLKHCSNFHSLMLRFLP